jgi:hypothetical protein
LRNLPPSEKLLELCHVFKNSVGRGVSAGKNGITNEKIHKSLMVLIKASENDLGFIIKTFFPSVN